MVKKVAYHSCGGIRSVWQTRIIFEGDGLNRGSLFGRLPPRAWSCAAVEKGNIWVLHCVRPTQSQAKRSGEFSEYATGEWRVLMRDFRAGKGGICNPTYTVLSEKQSRSI